LTYFLFYTSVDHSSLHSFPTRRSSDLNPRLFWESCLQDTTNIVMKKRHIAFLIYTLRKVKMGSFENQTLNTLFALLRVANFQHLDRKSTRLNSSHVKISYAVFCLKKKK